MRMYPPGSDAPYNGTKLVKFMELDAEIRLKVTKGESSALNAL